MNTPIQKAIDRYGNELEELIRHYSTTGVVYSDNRLFVMAVMHNKEILQGKNFKKGLDKLNCWYVHYAAGDIKRLYEICPYELTWVAFERGDKPLKFYKLDRIRRLSYGRK
tara:strand:+ start:34 stop:366 length:333 start_codon:yes stop_codon:yes gene_type:complete